MSISISGAEIKQSGRSVSRRRIEGDTATADGGRIEIGLSYVFSSDAFHDENSNNYPFDTEDVQLASFFIFEEDENGGDRYSASGKLDSFSLPGDSEETCTGYIPITFPILRQVLPNGRGWGFQMKIQHQQPMSA